MAELGAPQLSFEHAPGFATDRSKIRSEEAKEKLSAGAVSFIGWMGVLEVAELQLEDVQVVVLLVADHDPICCEEEKEVAVEYVAAHKAFPVVDPKVVL